MFRNSVLLLIAPRSATFFVGSPVVHLHAAFRAQNSLQRCCRAQDSRGMTGIHTSDRFAQREVSLSAVTRPRHVSKIRTIFAWEMEGSLPYRAQSQLTGGLRGPSRLLLCPQVLQHNPRNWQGVKGNLLGGGHDAAYHMSSSAGTVVRCSSQCANTQAGRSFQS